MNPILLWLARPIKRLSNVLLPHPEVINAAAHKVGEFSKPGLSSLSHPKTPVLSPRCPIRGHDSFFLELHKSGRPPPLVEVAGPAILNAVKQLQARMGDIAGVDPLCRRLSDGFLSRRYPKAHVPSEKVRKSLRNGYEAYLQLTIWHWRTLPRC